LPQDEGDICQRAIECRADMINLNKCAQECTECVLSYKKKHEEDFRTGRYDTKFHIECTGIPKSYVDPEVLSSLDLEQGENPEDFLDPVKWAAKYLDWHCLDPDGEVWKRKDPNGYRSWKRRNPDEDILGKSRFHRPYQGSMLKCTSKRKIFRIGRQCVGENSEVLLGNKKTKKIKDMVAGETIWSYNENLGKFEKDVVADVWATKNKVYRIVLSDGTDLIVTAEHELYTRIVDKKLEKIPACWFRIVDNLKVGDLLYSVNPSEIESKGSIDVNLDDNSWKEIIEISEAGEMTTYDLTAIKNKNFIANGKLVHNCGKSETLIISMLFNLFMRPGMPDNQGFKVILMTPFQTQADLLFRRMKDLIEQSPYYANEIESATKSAPCKIILKNGSSFTGFTAGSKNNTGAANIRGQDCSQLALDECDYLKQADIDSAMSLITNHPDATIWMSSTPSGRRDQFYDNCQSPRWKEFHFAAHKNPLWSKELEATFKEQLTDLAYIKEVEAGFGEDEQGVFQNQFVGIAMESYEYGDFSPRDPDSIAVGVDWNDEANGTTISIVGFFKDINRYRQLQRHTVSRKGWNLSQACLEIIKVNRFWNPEYIYVDKGYGSAQIEWLNAFALDAVKDENRGPTHPDAKLKSRVKPFDFGGTVEIISPWTKEKNKKPAKPFLVENAVRFVESGMFKFSGTDFEFEAQMRGYTSKRNAGSVHTTFVKGPKGDHALDAAMLALVAFALEESILGKPKFSTAMLTIPSLLEVNAGVENSQSAGMKLLDEQVEKLSAIQSQIDNTIDSSRNRNLSKNNSRIDLNKKTSVFDGYLFDFERELPHNNDLRRTTKRQQMHRPKKRNKPSSRGW
jgi:hypothetical protein